MNLFLREINHLSRLCCGNERDGMLPYNLLLLKNILASYEDVMQPIGPKISRFENDYSPK